MIETRELTNELLKGKMPDAVVDRGVIADLNAYNKTGFYLIDKNITQNLPNGMLYGRILMLCSGTLMVQFIFDWSQEKMTVRMASTSNLAKWYTLSPNG